MQIRICVFIHVSGKETLPRLKKWCLGFMFLLDNSFKNKPTNQPTKTAATQVFILIPGLLSLRLFSKCHYLKHSKKIPGQITNSFSYLSGKFDFFFGLLRPLVDFYLQRTVQRTVNIYSSQLINNWVIQGNLVRIPLSRSLLTSETTQVYCSLGFCRSLW